MHKMIVEFRRIGLMMSVELESEDVVNRVIERCIDNGVIIYWFLSTKNSFRIAPPLTISKEEIKKACEVILMSMNLLS